MDTNPKDVNDFHNESDVDSGPLAQHHTLGYGTNEAAPGHDVNRRLNIIEALMKSHGWT